MDDAFGVPAAPDHGGMRPTDLPPELTRGPFTVEAARRAGLSTKVLRGRRFTSPHRGVHRLATGDGDFRMAVHAARLVLPPGTLATGVTGLQLHGVEIGDVAPLHFVTTHPGPIRRPTLRVTRVSVLPEAWDEVVVVPEHCWLVAALDLNLLDLVIAADWLLRLRLLNLRTLESYVVASRSRGAGTARRARRSGSRAGGLAAGDVATTVPGARRLADAGLQPDHPRGRSLLARRSGLSGVSDRHRVRGRSASPRPRPVEPRHRATGRLHPQPMGVTTDHGGPGQAASLDRRTGVHDAAGRWV